MADPPTCTAATPRRSSLTYLDAPFPPTDAKLRPTHRTTRICYTHALPSNAIPSALRETPLPLACYLPACCAVAAASSRVPSSLLRCLDDGRFAHQQQQSPSSFWSRHAPLLCPCPCPRVLGPFPQRQTISFVQASRVDDGLYWLECAWASVLVRLASFAHASHCMR